MLAVIRDLMRIGKIFPDPLTMDFVRGMPRRELTSAERQLPYSGYYDRKMTEIPAEDIARVNAGPLDPSSAITIHERERLLEPGYLEAETGYTMLPDRSGFAATCVRMPGVTPAMLDWWFNWHPLEDVRYAIWCPVAHTGISARTPEAHLDESGVALHERNHGKTHYPIEGFDVAGAQKLRIEFLSPRDFGLDVGKMVAPKIATSYLANVLIDENDLPITAFFHAVREIEGGVEYRSRYWLGYSMVDGSPIRQYRWAPKHVVMNLARNNCIHSLTEYNHLASFLPQLYEEMQGRIDH